MTCCARLAGSPRNTTMWVNKFPRSSGRPAFVQEPRDDTPGVALILVAAEQGCKAVKEAI